MRNKKIFPFLILSISLFVGYFSFAHAQDNPNPKSGLAVTPPTFEISGNAGDSITNTVRVENTGDHPVRLAVDRRNFTAVGEEGAVGLTEEETGFSLASWISVDPGEITIPAKSTYTFNFTIRIPLSAEPGGHFGSLIFRTMPTDNVDGSGASLAQELGSLILLKIAGTTHEEAVIDSFEPVKFFNEYGPVTLSTRVLNQGNIHIKPTGTITITNMFGRKVANLTLDSKNVLPGALRRMDTTWDTKWGFGRYTATVVMVYGRDMTQRATVTNFILFPYRLVTAILFILLIIGYFVYRSRKRLSLAFKIIFTGKG